MTGGIAAYKTAALVSQLVQAGAGCHRGHDPSRQRDWWAPRRSRPLPAARSGWTSFGPGAHPHIELAEAAELLCIAPATANLLAKAAHGLADDLLSTL